MLNNMDKKKDIIIKGISEKLQYRYIMEQQNNKLRANNETKGE